MVLIFVFVLVAILYIVAILGLLMFILYLLGSQKSYTTSIPEGYVEVVFQGGDYLRPLINYEGWLVSKDGRIFPKNHINMYFDPRQEYDKEGLRIVFEDKAPGREKLIPAEGHPLDKIFSKYGINFVSLLWPHRQIHSLEVDVKRIVPDESGNKKDISTRIEHESESKTVRSFRIVFQRPVFIAGARFGGDKSQIDILVNTICYITNVYNIYGKFDGKIFSVIDRAISAEVMKYGMRPGINFEHFARGEMLSDIDKDESTPLASRSDFSRALLSVNSVGTEGAPTGLPSEIGVRVAAVWLIAFRGSDEKFDEVQREKELARLQAQALIEKGEGEKQYETLVAAGKAARWEQTLKAMSDHGVNPNVAAKAASAQIVSENIGSRDSKVHTWVQGDATPVIDVTK
ncbi:MAG: hypothetical protein MRY49_01655 [Candidatus Pacebacteria bacterium]|nr:hypothetical protein [Candidatus Paceibacterota bacterium]